jgi:tetratricopeptide (TPR) repeat protein
MLNLIDHINNIMKARSIRTIASALNLSSLIVVGVCLSGCTAPEDSPAVVLERAKILMQRDQPAEAVPLLDQAVTMAPESAEARYQRGVAMEAVGALEKALLDYNECLRISPDRKDALNNKAVVLAKLKRFDEAEAVFTRLVEINPEESLGYRNRALCNVEVKKYDVALADYAKALELDPKEPANWYQRAAVYQAQQRWAEADADFSKAIELDAELSPAYMNRGVVRYRMGDKAAAASDLSKAQELDSDIVVPDVGFFTQASGSATETTGDNGSALWIEAQTLAEQDLKNRGATEIELVQDFPAHGCGLFKVTIDGIPQSVVVSMADDKSFELPAELLQNESASAPTSPPMPQHLLLINGPSASSKALSVAMFQPNWSATNSNGRPSLIRFDLPGSKPN